MRVLLFFLWERPIVFPFLKIKLNREKKMLMRKIVELEKLMWQHIIKSVKGFNFVVYIDGDIDGGIAVNNQLFLGYVW